MWTVNCFPADGYVGTSWEHRILLLLLLLLLPHLKLELDLQLKLCHHLGHHLQLDILL